MNLIKNRHFSYKRRVVLTVPRLKELIALLKKHCDDIKFKAITKNKAEIKFDSFEELIDFNNYGEEKIASLNLRCRAKDDYDFLIDIDFSPDSPFNNDSVRCWYCFSNTDKESLFISDFEKFLDKADEYHNKYLICELASLAFCFVLGLCPIIIPIGGAAYYKVASGAYPVVTAALVFETIAIGLWALCSKLLWKKLFPRTIFAWGEGIGEYEKLGKLRANLFWGVLIAIVVSVFVGIILK